MSTSVAHSALDNTQISNIAACSVVYVLAITGLIISIFDKVPNRVRLGIDDGLMILAVISLTGELAGYVYCIKLGFGKHQEFLDAVSIAIIYKVFYILEILYMLTVVAVKISFSILIYKLSISGSKHRVINTTLFILTACYFIAALSVTVFQCRPIGKAWSYPSSDTPGFCMNLKALYLGVAIPNIATDVILTLIPIHLIMTLRMRTRRKFRLYLFFSVGSIITISSILRLWALLDLYYNPQDFTYIGPRPQLWSFVETGMGIAIATGSLPLMKMRPRKTPELFHKSWLARRVIFSSNKATCRSMTVKRLEPHSSPKASNSSAVRDHKISTHKSMSTETIPIDMVHFSKYVKPRKETEAANVPCKSLPGLEGLGSRNEGFDLERGDAENYSTDVVDQVKMEAAAVAVKLLNDLHNSYEIESGFEDDMEAASCSTYVDCSKEIGQEEKEAPRTPQDMVATAQKEGDDESEEVDLARKTPVGVANREDIENVNTSVQSDRMEQEETEHKLEDIDPELWAMNWVSMAEQKRKAAGI